MREGTAIISDGLDRLAAAAEVEDWAGMQAALARIREGTARMESGIAARRVASGESTPPAAATEWLKREMNLPSSASASPHGGGPFGWSWFHFVVMVALIAFAAAMIGMYYRKMRRAADLLQSSHRGRARWGRPGCRRRRFPRSSLDRPPRRSRSPDRPPRRRVGGRAGCGSPASSRRRRT